MRGGDNRPTHLIPYNYCIPLIEDKIELFRRLKQFFALYQNKCGLCDALILGSNERGS